MTWRKSSRCDSSACVEVAFRKASASGGTNCVEVGFRKSSHSGSNGCCVEVGTCTCDGVHVRDSKDPDGPVLSFTRDDWRGFLAGVSEGQFDRTG